MIDLKARSNRESTTSMFTCWNGHKDVVQLLFDNLAERNIDLNKRNNAECTSLMFACANGFKNVIWLHLDNLHYNIFPQSTAESRNYGHPIEYL